MINDNDVFEQFLTNSVTEGAKIADVVYMLNHKLAVNTDCPEKTEVLTEVLNEIQLYLTPVTNGVH